MLDIYLLWITFLFLDFTFAFGSNSEFTSNSVEKYVAYDQNDPVYRGVSIGGWLVTEPYITPTLYKNATEIAKNKQSTINIIDEYTLCQALGHDDARILLDSHFKTWITESDFKQISEEGFNIVRIPIGYWAWKLDYETNMYPGNYTYDDPYVNRIQLDYLNNAYQWAAKYNLKVMLDLHGVPGSQNGFDNSGQTLEKPLWLTKENSTEITTAILREQIDSIFNSNSSSSVSALEIVNEPLGPKLNMTEIVNFYEDTLEYYTITKNKVSTPASNVTFIIHDAFQSPGYWDEYLNPNYINTTSSYLEGKNYTYSPRSIVVDHHHYEVFTDSQLVESQYIRLKHINDFAISISEELSSHSAFVGEWSGAITDCATWLNGIGVGSRYDGTFSSNSSSSTFGRSTTNNRTCTSQNPVSEWSNEYKIQVRQFIEAQLAYYSTHTNGWIFWNWKTEGAAEWDYKELKKNGLFPHPFNKYKYFDKEGNIKPSVSSSLYSEYTSSLSSTASGASSTGAYKNGTSNLIKNKNKNILQSLCGWSLMLLCITVGATALF
ncbi:exoglucanase repeat family protein [Vanderwaltozyma polyspora DSM 70294]|uniref:Exoglucanase repeat family protein n=1 Tax=Vanderwaltozyma polyspora (strain ATCC 22028 / DSM 70294 / BCRC 21397 / CBS 2163 / NBRC 10782 / NRRL Y-8283 / UCD 57-17) TaxID=436907 RepID=A7TQ12_VANPO|nr:exoglucanase repeat family protein [Vanderwaltozyma polyspora DSM 70294]EDO15661.1 exoglucanase repeat family protein [Vanderwaltozyma polyspora DSM 70294]